MKITRRKITPASTDINAADQLVNNGKIQKGLEWNKDWHRFVVQSIAPDGKSCKISEDWISEDTGEPVHQVASYHIAEDRDGEFVWQDEYKDYAFKPNDPDGYSWWARMYATGADNYPYDLEFDGEDEYADIEDDYTSSTAGDYSPSNPWDAPGMSVHDFI